MTVHAQSLCGPLMHRRRSRMSNRSPDQSCQKTLIREEIVVWHQNIHFHSMIESHSYCPRRSVCLLTIANLPTNTITHLSIKHNFMLSFAFGPQRVFFTRTG